MLLVRNHPTYAIITCDQPYLVTILMMHVFHYTCLASCIIVVTSDFHCVADPALPHAPTLAVAAKLNELLLNCSFGDDALYCNVTMEINGMVMSATANGTFYGLVSNTLYPTSARAINRCGDYSETNASHWTCKV